MTLPAARQKGSRGVSTSTQNSIVQWKTQLLERASEVFDGGEGPKSVRADIKELHAKIGHQALEIDFLEHDTGLRGPYELICFRPDPEARRVGVTTLTKSQGSVNRLRGALACDRVASCPRSA